jgi:hypothetical protein
VHTRKGLRLFLILPHAPEPRQSHMPLFLATAIQYVPMSPFLRQDPVFIDSVS